MRVPLSAHFTVISVLFAVSAHFTVILFCSLCLHTLLSSCSVRCVCTLYCHSRVIRRVCTLCCYSRVIRRVCTLCCYSRVLRCHTLLSSCSVRSVCTLYCHSRVIRCLNTLLLFSCYSLCLHTLLSFYPAPFAVCAAGLSALLCSSLCVLTVLSFFVPCPVCTVCFHSVFLAVVLQARFPFCVVRCVCTLYYDSVPRLSHAVRCVCTLYCLPVLFAVSAHVTVMLLFVLLSYCYCHPDVPTVRATVILLLSS